MPDFTQPIQTLKGGPLSELLDNFVQAQRESRDQDDALIDQAQRMSHLLRTQAYGDFRGEMARLDEEYPGCDHASVLRQAIAHAGLLHKRETCEGYKDHFTSASGVNGSECYVSSGELKTEESGSRRFVVKSYVSAGGSRDKGHRLMNSRHEIKHLGFAVPRLYSVGPSCSVEEYIPYSIDEALAKSRTGLDDGPEEAGSKLADRQRIAGGFARLVARLDYQGRQPGIGGQVRIREDGQPVIIDFGVDIFAGVYPRLKTTNLNILREINDFVGDTKLMETAGTISAYSDAKNSFKPELNIVNIYDQELERLQHERPMPTEQTFLMIKPGFTKDRDAIIEMIQQKGYRIAHEGQPTTVNTEASPERGQQFYSDHATKPFFPGLMAYMTEGKDIDDNGKVQGQYSKQVIPLVVEGEPKPQYENFQMQVRAELIGPTKVFADDGTKKPEAEGTIRGRFALNGRVNTIHASDSPDAAKKEMALFGKELGLKPGVETETDPALPPVKIDGPSQSKAVG